MWADFDKIDVELILLSYITNHPVTLVQVSISPECMMTSSNRNIFRVTGHLCGEFTGPR